MPTLRALALLVLVCTAIGCGARRRDETTRLPLSASRLGLILRGAFEGRGGFTLVDLPSRDRQAVEADRNQRAAQPSSIDAAAELDKGWFYVVNRQVAEVIGWRTDRTSTLGSARLEANAADFLPTDVVAGFGRALVLSRDVASKTKAILWKPEVPSAARIEPFAKASMIPVCATRLGTEGFVILGIDPLVGQMELVGFSAEGQITARAEVATLVGSAEVRGPSSCSRQSVKLDGTHRMTIVFSTSQNVALVDLVGNGFRLGGLRALPGSLAAGESLRSVFLPSGKELAIATRVGPEVYIVNTDDASQSRVVRMSDVGNAVGIDVSADGLALLVALARAGTESVVTAYFLGSGEEIPVVRLPVGDDLVDIAAIAKP